MTTYGALFAGYGGLELGVQSVLGGHLAWYAEIDPAPSRVLAHHYPDAPNLGDVTRVDWTTVEPVDVLTGGTPCQDLSHAGKRKGMTDGTRSNLWVEMREAIALAVATLLSESGARDIRVTVWREYAADPNDRDTLVRALVADRHLAADMAERLGLREAAVEGGRRWAGTVSAAPVEIVTH